MCIQQICAYVQLQPSPVWAESSVDTLFEVGTIFSNQVKSERKKLKKEHDWFQNYYYNMYVEYHH